MRGSACGPTDWVWWANWGRGRPVHPRMWWAAVAGEPPPRAERGEVRFLVLEALLAQPRHGYEIIQHNEDRAGGAYRPSPGVIYPTLQMLEELGEARVVDQEGRKVYAITDAGRSALERNRQAVDDFYRRFEQEPWESYAEDFAELMRQVGRLVKAFRRGPRGGRMTPETIRAIRRALDEAIEKIEDALNGPRR